MFIHIYLQNKYCLALRGASWKCPIAPVLYPQKLDYKSDTCRCARQTSTDCVLKMTCIKSINNYILRCAEKRKCRQRCLCSTWTPKSPTLTNPEYVFMLIKVSSFASMAYYPIGSSQKSQLVFTSVLFFIVALLQPLLFFNKTLFPMGTALPGSSLYFLPAFQPAKL